MDESAQRFFIRTEFEGPADCAALEVETRSLLQVGADVQARLPTRWRIAILVSKEMEDGSWEPLVCHLPPARLPSPILPLG